MWPDRRLLDLFKTEFPIVLAPMAGAMDHELVIAAAQGGAFSQSPNRDAGQKAPANGAQIECGPIGCRPLPSGCRQVRLGGRWLDNNGLKVVCDRRRS